MKLSLYQVDAFSEKVFGGNPAAVVPLESWLSDETLQSIAAENFLPETAFFVPTDKGFHLRWFTPTTEMPLCGHATLASAFIIYSELGYDQDQIVFDSLSGELIVKRQGDGFVLNFPTYEVEEIDIPNDLPTALGASPVKLLGSPNTTFRLAIVNSQAEVEKAEPDFRKLAHIETGDFILSAQGDAYDFVSRVFAPAVGIDEDPVTGSAHCVSAPYWSKILQKETHNARQVSARGGDVTCTILGKRVDLFGKAVLYLKGNITI